MVAGGAAVKLAVKVTGVISIKILSDPIVRHKQSLASTNDESWAELSAAADGSRACKLLPFLQALGGLGCRSGISKL